jgi:hypothetical protein
MSNEEHQQNIEYRLMGPGTFDKEAKDFRAGYAIERVETRVIGTFSSRDEAREFMLAGRHRQEEG